MNLLRGASVLPCLLLVGLCGPVRANVIKEYTAGNIPSRTGIVPGISFVTPSGGQWINLTFNWFGVDSTQPIAFGNLYVLTEEYLGAPGDLSPSVPGYLYHVAASEGQYVFDSSEQTLSLDPDRRYYFYANELEIITGGGTQEGTVFYASSEIQGGFTRFTDPIANYRLSGEMYRNPGPLVPEPSGLLFAGLGAASLLGWSLGQRRKAVRRKSA